MPQVVAGLALGGDAAFELVVNGDVEAAAKSAGLEATMTIGGAAIGAWFGGAGAVPGTAVGYIGAKLVRLGRSLKGLFRKADGPNRGDGFVDGYRAVSRAEADDIAQNGFRADPSGHSMNDKWFSETPEGAEQFRKTFPDLGETIRAKVVNFRTE